VADLNDFRPGDSDSLLLRKSLARLRELKQATDATAAAVFASNSIFSAELQALQDSPDVFLRANAFGTFAGVVAQSFRIKGRRAGFNSISLSQDIGEFLGASLDLLPELTGGETLELVSSSASDSAAGVGTRTVRIVYLDTSNSLVQSAPITLNGVTPVTAGISAKFILWMESATGGSSEGAAGNIILRIAGGGATHEQISAGGNRSLSCRFMVPAGYSAYVPVWQTSAVGGAVHSVRLKATASEFDRSLATRYSTQSVTEVESGQPALHILPWLKFPALSKIKVSTLPSGAAATNRIDSCFSVLLVAN